jgi:hypothetical protein
MADEIKATPRGFISGLFSDVLGRTLNMPSLPRTGIPSLDLLYANRNSLFNMAGVGDVQKTAERISYGQPLTTGSGMTLRPREETIGAALTVAPFAPVAGRVAGRMIKATEGMPVGMSIRSVKAPQETALELAKINAAKTGQSLEAYPRSLQQGYEHDWYHGSTGDISNFRQDLLGETTGAQSAKKGFFFARDPQNPPASMMVKTTDPASIDLLKKLGKTDEEIAALNQVSMKGSGAETASGYAQIGGSREYREAMRNAKSAEKRGDWNEYEKQMQIAEDSEINRMNYAQSVVAKYGDARDEMLDTIQKTIYGKNLPQAEAEVLDKKYMELMPYGWYNSFDTSQFNALKKKLVDLVGEDAATPALKQIDNFKSVKAERMSVENTQEGGNVMPVALRYKKPMVYDFGGKAYREQTYSDLVDQALRGGHDALILKNTFDPAGGQAKLIDVGVVFSPDQIRSRFAAFDPFRKDVATATAMGVALPDLLAQPVNQYELPQDTIPMYTDPFGNTIGSSIR